MKERSQPVGAQNPASPYVMSRRVALQGMASALMMALLNGCASSRFVSIPSQPGENVLSDTPGGDPGPLVLRLMAPGSPLRDPARVERALTRFTSSGFLIQNEQAIARRYQHFAGRDDERLADLNALATMPRAATPDLIIATRGGYGTVRLLDRIDYERVCPRLQEKGTLLFGYSDITALQLALLARGGVVSFSGPMLNSDFGALAMNPMTLENFRRVLTQPSFTLTVAQTRSEPYQAEGILWGGNLTVLANLVGTPWLPHIDGGILFIEDVGEAIYRIERLLFQLYHAGILGRQKAVLVGHITDYKQDDFDPQGYTLQSALNAVRSRLSIPILTGLPIGHVAEIMSLPVGGRAKLDVSSDGYTLTVDNYPTLGKRASTLDWAAFDR